MATSNIRKTPVRVFLFVGALALACVFGFLYWRAQGGMRSTDDAFVDGDIVVVAAETSGRVEKIDVPDNGLVRQGAPLLEIDTEDLRLSLEEATAGLDAAEAQRASLPANAPVYSVRAAVAAVRAARARVAQVNLAISKATPNAPIDGYVARRAVSVGASVQPGQPLMAIVAQTVWVTANFKETETADLKPGEPVDIEVDAYPGVRLTGTVESMQHASGQAFSLLPPENASGNFVRLVQRVPVKIALNAVPAGLRLGPGLSARVSVHVQ
ncbi:MAG: HlyD family secretion protein [Pseudomonadota bacterium]